MRIAAYDSKFLFFMAKIFLTHEGHEDHEIFVLILSLRVLRDLRGYILSFCSGLPGAGKLFVWGSKEMRIS